MRKYIKNTFIRIFMPAMIGGVFPTLRCDRFPAVARSLFLGLALVITAPASWAQQSSDPSSGIDREELESLVRELIESRLGELGLLGEDFNERVKEGVLAFIEEQRQAQAEAQENSANALAGRARPVSATEDHVYGDPQAPFSLIEYSDFECPFCKRFHPTARRLVDENPDQVNWVYRHFPLAFHNPGAQKQAEASECAAELGGNDQFWRYTDLIYERTRSNGKGFPIEDLVPLATEIGLDEQSFSDCLDSGRYTARVESDFEDGQQAGVRGTPGNILRHNGSGTSLAVQGAQPYENVKQALDLMIESQAEN